MGIKFNLDKIQSGMPEYYDVYSMYGCFRVHESRCLIFRNGILPERTTMAFYRYWGVPEYVKVKQALRETITSHGYGVKMLERCAQAIYGMKNLSEVLANEDGEEKVMARLQAIDLARNVLNSIAIDAEGETYDFRNMSLAGVDSVIDKTCNMLSAVTNIPQTILFGRSPAGENATGNGDLENYYNYVERIQKLMLRNNLRTLLDVIIQSGIYEHKIDEKPEYELTYHHLWSLSDAEQANIDQQKATTELTKAQTAAAYVDMQVLDPTEVRASLAKDEEYDIEDLLNDVPEDQLWGMGEDGPHPPEATPEGGNPVPGAANATGEGQPSGSGAAGEPNKVPAENGKPSQAATAPAGADAKRKQSLNNGDSSGFRYGYDGIMVSGNRADAEFNESDHPRDKDGKFASGSGGGGTSAGNGKESSTKPKSAKKEKALAHPEMKGLRERIFSGEVVPVAKIMQNPSVQKAAEAQKKMGISIEDPKVYDPETKSWSPERTAIHKDVVDKIMHMGSATDKFDEKGDRIYDGIVARNRHADIVIGPPAAGKSSVFADRLSRDNQARIVDSDVAKELLPEFDGGNGANYLHEESAHITEDLVYDKALSNGDNMVLPLVGKNPKKIERMAKQLRDEGYSVDLYYNELDPVKAANRATTRFIENGRFVNPQYVASVEDKPGHRPSDTYKDMKEKGLFDYYEWRDNDVPRKTEAKLKDKYGTPTGRSIAKSPGA